MLRVFVWPASCVVLDPKGENATKTARRRAALPPCPAALGGAGPEALRGIEPMAWDFVMHFARDNDLQVAEGCVLPEPAAKP